MPVLKKPSDRRIASLIMLGLVLCLILLHSPAQAAIDETRSETPETGAWLNKKRLELKGQLQVVLGGKTEEALSKGIPLEFIIDIRLYRSRPWIWDELVREWSFRHRIHYHALSRQYLVNGRGPDDKAVESFSSLQEAVSYLGSLDGIALQLKSLPAKDMELDLAVRAHLDIEALPPPLKPVAYTSPSWRINTGWESWKVHR